MIPQVLAQLFGTIADFVLGLFPADFALPDWLSTVGSAFGQVIANGQNLSVWVPWAIVGSVVAFVFSLWAIGFVIKAARWLLGLIPTMGGG